MDQLIAELSKYGPIGLIAGLMLFMYRKKIIEMLMGSSTDRAAEILLTSIDKNFKSNLDYFKETEKNLVKTTEELKDIGVKLDKLISIQYDIHMEIIRQGVKND